MKAIIGLGAEAHAATVMEMIERSGSYEIAALVNDDEFITIRTLRCVPITVTLCNRFSPGL
jgi:hypothetical protein